MRLSLVAFWLRVAVFAVAWFVLPESSLRAQIEHIPAVHPVYEALIRWEALGALPDDFSSSALPLRRADVVAALRSARRREALLASADRAALARFEREFGVAPAERYALFASATDSARLPVASLFGDGEKLIFHYSDSAAAVGVEALGALEVRLWRGGAASETALLADVGGRAYGTLDSCFGFFLQGTNGALLAGNRSAEFLANDPVLRKNLTWTTYTGGNGGNFDFSESHARYEKRWFYAGIGRETRRVGAGYFARGLFSDNPPVADALTLGARFGGFEYRFEHFSLLAQPTSPGATGVGAEIPLKFMAFHRAAFRGAWGEVGLSEQVIYSRRGLDLAYLAPVSFLRAVSNALRDRDNLQMAFDLTLRPFSGAQLKMNWLLDDMRFGEIGKGWWANKTAWNAGVLFAAPASAFEAAVDCAVEYARVEPYAFSHFDPQNAATHDGFLFAGALQPNSDELTARLRFWGGGRFPIALTCAWRRHGRNEYDAQGALKRNVGGDAAQTLRVGDAERATFLDGELERTFLLTLSAGIELARQWNVAARWQLQTLNGATTSLAVVSLRFGDF